MGRNKTITDTKEYHRQYYQNHKEKYSNEYKPKNLHCDICDKEVNRMSRHSQTIKHQYYLMKKNQQ